MRRTTPASLCSEGADTVRQQQKVVKAALLATLFLGFVVAALSLVLQPS